MNIATWLAFSIGAGVGAPSRYLLDTTVQTHTNSTQPRGTLTVNAIGSLILGTLTGLIAHQHLSDTAGTIIGTGFCGALTTYSTFAFETVRLLEEGATIDAAKNILLNTTIAVTLAALGYGAALHLS
jgi:CrcB protein